eukprot:6186167-Pleurochrysis_carterae.AAC.2
MPRSSNAQGTPDESRKRVDRSVVVTGPALLDPIMRGRAAFCVQLHLEDEGRLLQEHARVLRAAHEVLHLRQHSIHIDLMDLWGCSVKLKEPYRVVQRRVGVDA